MKPDIEKIHAFAPVLRKVKLPAMETDEGWDFVRSSSNDLNALADECASF